MDFSKQRIMPKDDFIAILKATNGTEVTTNICNSILNMYGDLYKFDGNKWNMIEENIKRKDLLA